MKRSFAIFATILALLLSASVLSACSDDLQDANGGESSINSGDIDSEEVGDSAQSEDTDSEGIPLETESELDTDREPACPHTECQVFEEKAATCDKSGNEAYKRCNTCGAILDSEGDELIGVPELSPIGHSWQEATLETPKTCTVCGATDGGILEIEQDNIFTAADLLAAYRSHPSDAFTGELVEEDGVTFFKATAIAKKLGRLVLNSGNNTVDGAGNSIVVVYRNKTEAISRIAMEINSSGKTNAQGAAAPYADLAKSDEWGFVILEASSSLNLSNGAGYMSVDIFATGSSGKVVTEIGDVMEIALIAAVDSEETAKNTAGEECGEFLKFPYAANIIGLTVNGVKQTNSAVLPNGQQAVGKAIEMDLESLRFGGLASSCVRLGAGWVITRGGWDHYEYRIIPTDGSEGRTVTFTGGDLGGTTLATLTNNFKDYGSELGKGGSLFTPPVINLEGFEGKNVTIEIWGISNFGMEYKLMNAKNVRVPAWDNIFLPHDFAVMQKASTDFKSEVLSEDGVTFFRATATQAKNGRVVINSGSGAIKDFGKTFILVYRNRSANSGQKFQLYVSPASGSGTMIPAIAKENTDEWKIAILNYSHTMDLSEGAGNVYVDLFFNNCTVGDTIDIALFAAVENEDVAWATFFEELGDSVRLPYTSNIGGITIGGVSYKDSSVLVNGQKITNAPVIIDLGGVRIDDGVSLSNGFSLGAGYTVTRDGWDYFICNITARSGLKRSYRISDGIDIGEGSILTNLKNEFPSYGGNLGVGGSLLTPLKLDLTGFVGEEVTVEIVGISNIGAEYTVAKIINLKLPGIAGYAMEDDFISFFDYTVPAALRSFELKNGDKLAASFTVPAGERVRELKLGLTGSMTVNTCSVGVSIYSFNGSYAESVATEPIYQKHVTETIKWVNLEIPEGVMPAGDYLVVVEYIATDSKVYTTAMIDNAWNTLPDNLAKYNIQSYKNGEINTSFALAGGIETVKIGTTVPENDKIDADFEKDTAKVIVILGQSNAVGTSMNGQLQNAVSAADFEKYGAGFSNTKMYYVGGTISNGGIKYTNTSSSFVNVKIGQGCVTWSFGPEVGLAEYLEKICPDEEFYIIKYAIGGTSMDSFWNVNDPGARQGIDELQETIDAGLALLEGDGLKPEIIGFLWMQGEGDCGTSANRAYPYYGIQKSFMAFLREEYAEYSPDGGDIPFIDAEIADLGNWTASYIINDHKKELDRESGRNYLIDTNFMGLTTLYENNDLAHYDSTSMLLLGELFARTLDDIYGFSE